MVGRLKFARETPGKKAKKGYVALKNSTGRSRLVREGATVYHRGKGRYAQYSEARDRKRKAHTRIPARRRAREGHMGDTNIWF
jgi:hypothetical protein